LEEEEQEVRREIKKEDIMINVRRITGPVKSYRVKYDSNILDLKLKIQEEEGTLIEQQRIIVKGVVYSNETPIRNILKDGDSVFLNLRLSGC